MPPAGFVLGGDGNLNDVGVVVEGMNADPRNVTEQLLQLLEHMFEEIGLQWLNQQVDPTFAVLDPSEANHRLFTRGELLELFSCSRELFAGHYRTWRRTGLLHHACPLQLAALSRRSFLPPIPPFPWPLTSSDFEDYPPSDELTLQMIVSGSYG